MQHVSLEAPLSFGPDASGVAYLGRLEGSQELVVLRELSLEASSPQAKLQIERAAHLKHPRIVSTLGAWVAGERCYLVSEFVPGLPLAQLLAQGDGWQRLSPATLAYIASEALQALAAAQQLAPEVGVEGALHGSITPWSIIITAAGQVRLSGLGTSATLDDLGSDADPRAALRWASPEKGAGQPLDQRSDVYSMGAVLWEALTRSSLDRASAPALSEFSLDAGEVSRTRSRAPDTDLLSCCRRALQPNPKRRYQTALEFAQAIDAYLRKRGTGREPAELRSLIQVVYPGSPYDVRRLQSRGSTRSPAADELMDIDEALDHDETTSRTDLSFIARALTGPPIEKPAAEVRGSRRREAALAVLVIVIVAAKILHFW